MTVPTVFFIGFEIDIAGSSASGEKIEYEVFVFGCEFNYPAEQFDWFRRLKNSLAVKHRF